MNILKYAYLKNLIINANLFYYKQTLNNISCLKSDLKKKVNFF